MSADRSEVRSLAPNRIVLSADLIEAFAGTFLSPRYDEPKPTPPFHREAWALYASDHMQVSCVAPRNHAKSTGLTFDYILAEVLFRVSDYVILISSTEDKAAEQLSNISDELHDNADLRAEFGVRSFETDGRTDIIAVMSDGHRFRILARGAEQKIRGAMWKGKRPNLIVCDDMEDDEQVESKERRAKFRRWFFRAAKQALSKSGKIRVHGTILHEDSLLARLQKNKTWKCLFYKAHRSFDDFSDRIWPERWSEEELKELRQEFIEDGDSAGYSQELLNDPQDNASAFLRSDDFIPMKMPEDFDSPKKIGVGWDFAVSKADFSNRTSCTVGGKDLANVLHFLDFRVGRWNPSVSPAEKSQGETGWIDLMFEVEGRWHPEFHAVEGGVIWTTVKNTIYQEMQTRDCFLNIIVLNPVKDKATRGMSLKKRHRAGATRWNTQAEGYEGAKEELLKFTGSAVARLDDQFDSAATLSLGFDGVALVEEEDFFTPEDFEMEEGFHRRGSVADQGRSAVTGY
jgi:hypothetical protein